MKIIRYLRSQRRQTVSRLFMFASPMPWCNRCQCWHYKTADHIPRNGTAQEIAIFVCLGLALSITLSVLACFALIIDWPVSP